MLIKVNSIQNLLEKETHKFISHTTEIYIKLDCISSITIRPVLEWDRKYISERTIVRMIDGYSFDIDDQELERIVELCNKIQRKLK